MRKFLLILIFSVFFGVINVNADNHTAEEGTDYFSLYETEYNKGIVPTTINGTGIITLYGYASCDSTGCSIRYGNTSSDYREVLKLAVKCSGGETSINYNSTRGDDKPDTSNSKGYSGKVYFSEEFGVTCTNAPTAGSSVTLDNSSNNGNNGGTIGGSTGGTGGSTGSNGGYNSSTTTNNPNQGVETYYIVLGILGLITYGLMTVVKKYNLFKNV